VLRAIKLSYLSIAVCFPILLTADYTIAQNTTTTNTPSDDATFQRVFGRPRTNNSKRSLTVPLVIDNREQATIRITFVSNQPEQTRLQSKATLQELKPILRPEVFNIIETAIGNAEDFSVNVLQKNGIEVVFDERRLAIFLQISPAVRPVNVLGDRANLPPEAKDAIPVSNLSGYVNIFASDRFTWASNQIGGIQRQPFFIGLDGAINFQNWVLEGNWSFAEKGKPELTRGDIRLVRDDPNNAVRYIAGDFSFPTTGFQSAIAVGGIAAARNFSLQPYAIIRPINNFEFFLLVQDKKLQK
jgi:outer membrane usher protein